MDSNRHIVVFGWMCNELGLSGNELLVYAIIHGFSQDGESCYQGSRKWLADTLNVSLPTIDKALSGLIQKGYIAKSTRLVNGIIFCDYRALQGIKILYTPCKESLHPPCKESLHQITNIENTKENKERATDKPMPFDFVLDSVEVIKSNPALRDAFIEYIKMRKMLKKPLTDRALKLNINEAYKLSGGQPDVMQAIVEQSIRRSWAGIFPLKADTSFNKTGGSSGISYVGNETTSTDQETTDTNFFEIFGEED